MNLKPKTGDYIGRYAQLIAHVKTASKTTIDDAAVMTELSPGACRRFLGALTSAGLLTQSEEKAVRQMRLVWRWNP